MAVRAKFFQLPPSGDITCARHKASVTRADEKFPALGFGAMLPDGEQNHFLRQSITGKFLVPCPARPFFSGGFEPRLALRYPGHSQAIRAGSRQPGNAAGHLAGRVRQAMRQKPRQSSVAVSGVLIRSACKASDLPKSSKLPCVFAVSPDTGAVFAKCLPYQLRPCLCQQASVKRR